MKAISVNSMGRIVRVGGEKFSARAGGTLKIRQQHQKNIAACRRHTMISDRFGLK
jgi:hypothetical protein